MGYLPIMSVSAKDKIGTSMKNQGQARTSRDKEGTSRDKAGTKQDKQKQAGTSPDSPSLSLSVSV